MAEQAEQSREARLLAAGFVRSMGFWKVPGREQVMSLDDAIAGLDSGAIKPEQVVQTRPWRADPVRCERSECWRPLREWVR